MASTSNDSREGLKQRGPRDRSTRKAGDGDGSERDQRARSQQRDQRGGRRNGLTLTFIVVAAVAVLYAFGEFNPISSYQSLRGTRAPAPQAYPGRKCDANKVQMTCVSAYQFTQCDPYSGIYLPLQDVPPGTICKNDFAAGKRIIQFEYKEPGKVYDNNNYDDDTNSGVGNQGSGNSGTGSVGVGNSGIGNVGDGNSGIGNVGNGNSGSGNNGVGNSGTGNNGYGNSGSSNTGAGNSGSGNNGVGNSGTDNNGYGNSGSSNTGAGNSGSGNSGVGNSGTDNNGYGNSGSSNTGAGNSGSGNNGVGNSGTGNNGYGNSGSSNAGAGNSGSGNNGIGNSGSSNAGAGNAGSGNDGFGNSGNSNTGFGNAGTGNVGVGNSGQANKGSGNSGEGNFGNGNSGSGNIGFDNAGSGNNGIGNSGSSNKGPGVGNSGDNNSGFGNSGSGNTGSGSSGSGNTGAGSSGINLGGHGESGIGIDGVYPPCNPDAVSGICLRSGSFALCDSTGGIIPSAMPPEGTKCSYSFDLYQKKIGIVVDHQYSPAPGVDATDLLFFDNIVFPTAGAKCRVPGSAVCLGGNTRLICNNQRTWEVRQCGSDDRCMGNVNQSQVCSDAT